MKTLDKPIKIKKEIWWIAAAIGAGIIGYLIYRKMKKTPVPAAQPAVPGAVPGGGITKKDGVTLITNYDSVWDYKLDNDVWYTKQKTSTDWLNMKERLTPENYQLAVSRLTNFLAKN